MFELALFAKKEIKAPEEYPDYEPRRKYYSCVLVTMNYRGHVAQQQSQTRDYYWARGGNIEIHFDSFAVNEEELTLVNKKMQAEDVEDSMAYSGDMATEALETLKDDLKLFLEGGPAEIKKEETKEEKRTNEDTNPFSVLFKSLKHLPKAFKKQKKEWKKAEDAETLSDIEPDNVIEKKMRENAKEKANEQAYKIYDIYKKAHGMASAPVDLNAT
jgi:hypothetical protein